MKSTLLQIPRSPGLFTLRNVFSTLWDSGLVLRHARSISICCALMFASALAGFGWGGLGHVTVALVAWDRLEPKARTELAKGAPEIYGRQSGVDILLHAAKWPDIIRDLHRKEDAEYYDTPLSIFAGIGVELASDADDFHYDNRLPNGGIVTNKDVRASVAIKRSQEVLASATSTPRMRAEALAFLAHCVGDIHQPLHAGYKRDLGGNSIKNVRLPDGRRFTLHTLWDSGRMSTTGIVSSRRYYGLRLQKLVAKLEPTALADLDADSWSANSFRLAKDYAYADEAGASVRTGTQLSAKYVEKGVEIVDQQLILGGVRLAAVLNKTLGGQSEPQELSQTLQVGAAWSLHIVIFDVGQADAIALITPQGDACIIDAGHGAREAAEKSAKPRIDQPTPEAEGAIEEKLNRIGAVPLAKLTDTADLQAWARVKLKHEDPKSAVQAYGLALAKAPRNVELLIERAIAQLDNGEPAERVLPDVIKARGIALESATSSETFYDLYNVLVYTSLFLPPPEGFSQAIRYAKEYITRFGLEYGGAIWTNLACAYGQQAKWAVEHDGKSSQAYGEARRDAFEAAKKSRDLGSADRLRELLVDDDPMADDLKIFKDDAEFRTLLGLPVKSQEKGGGAGIVKIKAFAPLIHNGPGVPSPTRNTDLLLGHRSEFLKGSIT